MQALLGDHFFTVDARHVDVSWTALRPSPWPAGMLTTRCWPRSCPRFKAFAEKRPTRSASSQRRLHPKLLATATVCFSFALGTAMIWAETSLPPRWAHARRHVHRPSRLACSPSPFLFRVSSRLSRRFVRRYLTIECRLAADNIVRFPGRTGLVIGALGAGLSLSCKRRRSF